MHKEHTENARWLHRQRASFFISLCQKEGASMDGYDNDLILLILDDDLFWTEEEEDDVS